MAKKVEIEIDVKGDDKVKGLGQEIRELNKQLRQTPEGTKEWTQIYNRIDDLKDRLEGSKKASSDLVDTIASAPGPIGVLGRGINSLKVATTSFGAALKATGIGLLVSLVAGLATAFSQSEEAGKKLKPLIEGFQRLFNGVYRALEPVLDTLIELATQALPYVTKAFSVSYSAISSFIQGVGLLARSIGKLLTGDFAGAWDDASNAVTGFGDRFNQSLKNFEKGTKELTASEREELKKRQEAEKEALEKRKQQQEEYRKQVEEDTKRANEKLLSLQNEYEQLSAKNDAQANKIKLRQDYEQEQKEISALKLKDQRINGIVITGEELRQKLLLQAKENYNKKSAKIDADDAKRVADEIKKLNDTQFDLLRKALQSEDDIIENDTERRKAKRERQLEEEIFDLNELEAETIKAYKKLIDEVPSKREELEKEIDRVIAFSEDLRKNKAKIYKRELIDIIQEGYKEEEAELIKKIDAELRLYELRNQVLNKNTQRYFDNQEELIKKGYEKEKMLEEQNFKALIQKAREKQKFQINNSTQEVEVINGIMQRYYYDDLGNRKKVGEEIEKLEKQKADKLLAIEEKYQADKKNLKQQEVAAYGEVAAATINSFAAITGALASGYDEEAKTSKAAFEQRKKLQIATATMSAASGIIQILTQPSTLPSPFDWIVKVANAAALGITTAINISNIKKTKFEGTEGGGEAAGGNRMGRGYADGGIVRGPGTSKSDSIPARLSNGEAVMTSGAVTMFAPLLSMMNQMGGGTSFNSGLNATLPDNPNRANPSMEQQPLIMKTYVVENELTSSQQRQARLKDLSTL